MVSIIIEHKQRQFCELNGLT